MTDFHKNQKLDFISLLVATSTEMVNLDVRSAEVVKKWFGNYFQDSAPNDLTEADLIDSKFEGMTEDEIENIIGSLEAFAAFMGTHGGNFRLIAGIK